MGSVHELERGRGTAGRGARYKRSGASEVPQSVTLSSPKYLDLITLYGGGGIGAGGGVEGGGGSEGTGGGADGGQVAA